MILEVFLNCNDSILPNNPAELKVPQMTLRQRVQAGDL